MSARPVVPVSDDDRNAAWAALEALEPLPPPDLDALLGELDSVRDRHRARVLGID